MPGCYLLLLCASLLTSLYCGFFVLYLAGLYPPVVKILEQCGKFQLFDRLLNYLIAQKHKVYGFSSPCIVYAHTSSGLLHLYLISTVFLFVGSSIFAMDKSVGHY